MVISRKRVASWGRFFKLQSREARGKAVVQWKTWDALMGRWLLPSGESQRVFGISVLSSTNNSSSAEGKKPANVIKLVYEGEELWAWDLKLRYWDLANSVTVEWFLTSLLHQCHTWSHCCIWGLWKPVYSFRTCLKATFFSKVMLCETNVSMCCVGNPCDKPRKNF